MKNKSIIWILILIFLVSNFIPIISSYKTTSNNIIYVDDDADPSWYDETHVNTIHEGINKAYNGDTVFVYKGIYKGQVNIKKAIYLNGEDRNNTIIDAMGYGDVVSIKKSFASISNFTLQNLSIDEYRDGIVINNCYNITIKDNTFIGCGISYDYLTPSTYYFRNTVRNNIVNGKPLIYLEEAQNEIIDFPTGQIILSNCSNITVSYQNISHLHNGIVVFNSDDCTLYKNRVSNTVYGIVLYYSNLNNLSDNVLSENLIGIIYGASSNNNIFNNIIESNEKGIEDNISPYVSSSDNNTIMRNIIQNNSDGINLKHTKSVFIRYNSVKDNKYKGVSICYSSESLIEHNNFYRNMKSVYFMEVNDTINIVIDGNYWGRARLFPKPILGLKRPEEGYIMPWFFFDWHPALEPFDILGVNT
jgi:nitrous oxidase accessory protein